MATTEQIWILAKRRFLQEAAVWTFSNKFLEVITIVGGSIGAYLLSNVPDEPGLVFGTLTSMTIFAVLLSVFEMTEREKYFDGYFQAYEIGFEDGTGDNINDHGIEEGIKPMDDEVNRGLSNVRGYIFNRVNIYNKSPWK